MIGGAPIGALPIGGSPEDLNVFTGTASGEFAFTGSVEATSGTEEPVVVRVRRARSEFFELPRPHECRGVARGTFAFIGQGRGLDAIIGQARGSIASVEGQAQGWVFSPNGIVGYSASRIEFKGKAFGRVMPHSAEGSASATFAYRGKAQGMDWASYDEELMMVA